MSIWSFHDIDPEDDHSSELSAAAEQVGELFHNCAMEALSRLKQAENRALDWIKDYTPQDRLLTLSEAAAYLGFSPRTLNSWTKPGKAPLLPFIMIGGEKRFRLDSLNKRLAELEVRNKKMEL